ncbi:hypothetical protein L7F22_048381 [Adiantum nelumboides]|nr:hypothetical protein [Adiantum nelumboides]
MSLLTLLSCMFRLQLANFTLFTFDDIFTISKFLISLYFLYKSVYAPQTGAHACEQVHPNLKLPLLKHENGYAGPIHENYAPSNGGFARANFFTKLTFSWLSPLLVSGSKSSLEMHDVPELARGDMAESMYALFQKNCPQDPKCMRPVTVTILKSFWPQMFYTGLLQLVRSFVMFCGPLLIPSFTNYAHGVYVTSYDGYALVALLLLSKIVEVIALHQCNFLCYKLGNNIRTGISTVLYHKALRLSSSSRQMHGVGTITNYMIVDAQQISEACLQLHLLWAVPLQVFIAMVILFYVLGLSSLGGLLVMLLIGLFTAWLSQKQGYYQEFLMKCRDMRMKAIIEALAYIKVIKLQAWEEKFRKRVEYLRQKEFTWLTKFVMSMAYNSIANWNTQSLISTITYLVAVLIGTQLSNSIIFTAASVFRIIQSPIRNLPLAFSGLSQMIISLNRIDKFMLAPELQEGAVSRSPILEDYSVVVENGSFAWGEEGLKSTIKDINLNVKKGSLVMIVGKVGSGKSSLLSALLGEMMKLCGKVSFSCTFPKCSLHFAAPLQSS